MSSSIKISLMIVYAIVMFASIQANLSLLSFIVLFAILPVGIYFYVKKIFPDK